LASLVIVAVLTVQGFAVLLPANLLVYFEMRKATPDGARIGRLMQRYIYAVASQGVMQVAIILVMARSVSSPGFEANDGVGNGTVLRIKGAMAA
jgi:hypothetical protein